MGSRSHGDAAGRGGQGIGVASQDLQEPGLEPGRGRGTPGRGTDSPLPPGRSEGWGTHKHQEQAKQPRWAECRPVTGPSLPPNSHLSAAPLLETSLSGLYSPLHNLKHHLHIRLPSAVSSAGLFLELRSHVLTSPSSTCRRTRQASGRTPARTASGPLLAAPLLTLPHLSRHNPSFQDPRSL